MASEKIVEVPTISNYKKRLLDTGKGAKQGLLISVFEIGGELLTGSKAIGSLVGLAGVPLLGEGEARRQMARQLSKEFLNEVIMN
jgi:hypothetical protein